MFNARSPLTHLITVQTSHQSKISAPIAKCSVRSPTKKYRSPIQKVYLKLEMRLAYPICTVPLKISDHYAYKGCNAGKEANQIQKVDG